MAEKNKRFGGLKVTMPDGTTAILWKVEGTSNGDEIGPAWFIGASDRTPVGTFRAPGSPEEPMWFDRYTIEQIAQDFGLKVEEV